MKLCVGWVKMASGAGRVKIASHEGRVKMISFIGQVKIILYWPRENWIVTQLLCVGRVKMASGGLFSLPAISLLRNPLYIGSQVRNICQNDQITLKKDAWILSICHEQITSQTKRRRKWIWVGQILHRYARRFLNPWPKNASDLCYNIASNCELQLCSYLYRRSLHVYVSAQQKYSGFLPEYFWISFWNFSFLYWQWLHLYVSALQKYVRVPNCHELQLGWELD